MVLSRKPSTRIATMLYGTGMGIGIQLPTLCDLYNSLEEADTGKFMLFMGLSIGIEHIPITSNYEIVKDVQRLADCVPHRKLD